MLDTCQEESELKEERVSWQKEKGSKSEEKKRERWGEVRQVGFLYGRCAITGRIQDWLWITKCFATCSIVSLWL